MPAKTNKTAAAIALMAKEGITAYAAAERMGIKTPSVYAAIKRAKSKAAGVCASCGGPVDADGRHRSENKKARTRRAS
jgi:predicted DNA-binding protein (UPF0251 family)